MSEIRPGIHPRFDMSNYEHAEQRILERLSRLSHLNRHGVIHLTNTVKYNYALIRPAGLMRGLLHTEREVIVLFSPYSDFQSRTLDAFDRILEEFVDKFRIEKVTRILISEDSRVSTKLKELFKSKPEAPVVVPFHIDEIDQSTSDQTIASRIREFTYSRDLFSMSSPLRADLYFYGRSDLIHEITSKLASGENFGLFGLRRSGKTSIVNGLATALKSRSGIGVVIDCQNPDIHQRRWHELLQYIAKKAREVAGVKTKVLRSSEYSEKDAADTFLNDMKAIRSASKMDFVAILFDEVERISQGTASSAHWNEDRDFLHFWQAIRYGFQSNASPFTFLIVGTNPSAVEKTKIFESDNPLYGNVEKRFIPMFTAKQVAEMVDDLGAIMGVHFNDECKSKLHTDFGGHPFLTRYACSYIAASSTARPLTVDRTTYARGAQRFRTESGAYVESVVQLLENEYADEYEMLKYLGHGEHDNFNDFAESDLTLCEHLVGYGLVEQGTESYYFRLGIVEMYFKSLERPVTMLSQVDRGAEISRRRNELERKLRSLVRTVFCVHYSEKKRRAALLGKVSAGRRENFAGVSFDELLLEGGSPLYFDELKSIVLGSWEMFEHVMGVQKNAFEYHMDTINAFRVDAHARDIGDRELNRCRTSLDELEQIVSQGG